MNVKLKSGEYFEGKDITSSPGGEHDRLVSFWHEGKVRAYPIAQIEYFELVPKEA